MLSFTSRVPLRPEDPFLVGDFLLITAGTFQKRPFILGDGRKQMLLESIDFNCYKWKWMLRAFAIMDNHYHLIVQTPPGDTSRLAHIIQSAHSFSAYHWRRDDPNIRSRIWWNFWETPFQKESDLRQTINYLHENPRYHGQTDTPRTYPFSSYAAYWEAEPAVVDDWESRYPARELEMMDNF